jgi:hypothetical protein
MSIIKIKRSGTTGGAPTPLAQGEFAYSFLSGTQSNGGDKLYLGTGTETAGDAANKHAVGGYYYTQKLDHVPGTLQSNAAIIVDANSKIDILNIDNITINGNSITSTNVNGDIIISPDGAGQIDVQNSDIINLNDPTNNQDAATKKYVDDQFLGAATIFTLAADTGTSDLVSSAETITFTGDTGITTTVSNNEITIDLDDTAVTPGSYGNTTSIPTFTVDQQGRLTSAGSVSVATQLTIEADAGGSDTVDLLTNTLTFTGDTGISTTVANNEILIDLDDTAVTPGSYGSATAISTFTVDQQGRLTAAGTTNVAIPHTQVTDWEEAVQDAIGNGVSGMLNGTQNGISVVYDDPNGNLDFDVDDFTITLDGDLSGNVTITDLGSATLTATIVENSVELGSDTTGDYVSNLIEGTGVTITDNTGESATPTIAIGQDVSETANVTFQNGDFTGDVLIEGSLIVQGNSSIITTTQLEIEDNLIHIGGNNAADIIDLGWVAHYHDGESSNHAGVFRDATNKEFYIFSEYTKDEMEGAVVDINDPSFALANVNVDTVIGALQGNADTASALETARTIELSGDIVGSVSFDGSGNVEIITTIQQNSVALGTDTTGDYVQSVDVTAGTGLSVSGTGESATVTIAGVNASTTTKGVASFSSDNFNVSSGAVSIAAIDGGTY